MVICEGRPMEGDWMIFQCWVSLIWREKKFADDVLVWVFSVPSPVFFPVNGRLVVVVVGGEKAGVCLLLKVESG